MKMSMPIVIRWRRCVVRGLPMLALVALLFGKLEPVRADDFFCSSGDVSCLIAAINSANVIVGKHAIVLEPGIYTLQVVNNSNDGANGLPSITNSILIEASADDPATIIERSLSAAFFRIFHVSVGGKLSLEGITVQRGVNGLDSGAAILNRGVTSLQNSIVTNSGAEKQAIRNLGTLNVFKSTIIDNFSTVEGGGILNEAGGTVLLENSTIAHNRSEAGGGILNDTGSLVVRNSAIIFNMGGGIFNRGGSVEILNSTIAKNTSGLSGGGGVLNGFGGGQISITNSTIRENTTPSISSPGAGLFNTDGTVRVQNTIIAGNTLSGSPDCAGTVSSLGNNLVGDPMGCTINLQSSDLTGNSGLGALVGTKQEALPGQAYYPVLAGSAIIDKGNPNACPQVDQVGNFRVDICDIGAIEFRGPILASVDIRPKSDANRINPNTRQNINVAIFTVSGFDATTIDPKTVRFGATGTEAAPIHIATRDVDGNGSRDMLLRFQVPESGIKCGDTGASLTGQTFAGLSFVGSSAIKTVQCGKQR